MFILRLPLKLLALPLVTATSLLQWIGILLVSVSSTLVNMLLGVVSMIVMASWMFGLTSAWFCSSCRISRNGLLSGLR